MGTFLETAVVCSVPDVLPFEQWSNNGPTMVQRMSRNSAGEIEKDSCVVC